jgi:hypothetical protein
MKIILALAALLNLTYADDWELEDVGLCIEKASSCPSRQQRYGVCCKINGVAT